MDVSSAGSPFTGQSIDSLRSRELYKYFRPPVARCSSEIEPPDTVLTAHAQLLAWRLDAQRAMVSLIDNETQYFIAESTKTLHLDDALQYDDPDDAVWAGCTSVPKAGRLCEQTILTPQPADGGPACFEVCDLSQDERFNKLPFVEGAPHFRYYLGVPIRTRKGINIGSIFALDTKVRDAATATQRQFMGVMADNVVQHLEMFKEKRDRYRSMAMNRCLSIFVDPERRKRSRLPTPSTSYRGDNSRSGSRNFSATDGYNSSDTDANPVRKVDDDAPLKTFNSATKLLCEALSCDEDPGGVVFLDTIPKISHGRPAWKPRCSSEASSSLDSDSHDGCPTSHGQRTPDTQDNPIPSMYQQRPLARARPAEVIAHASLGIDRSQSSSPHKRTHMALTPEQLHSLIKRYPHGRLFTFCNDGIDISSSSDEPPDYIPSLMRRSTSASSAELTIFRESFPDARQLIFLPLWNASTTRWTACLAYNNSEYFTWSKNPDFLYAVAFCNCISTELARLATVMADQQKSDFIGSISHELRSPLHGILASCEFLGDTETTSFQRSLVDTADSCARTLLDTINMVLDYSKINTFDRSAGRMRKSKRDVVTNMNSRGLRSHLSIYSDVDVAAITEEVVEGVATGHIFRDSLANADIHEHADVDQQGRTKRSSLVDVRNGNAVEVIVDIPARKWIWWSQAGALRRIVMNLFGNALKYTKKGWVHVRLEAEDVQSPTDSDVCANLILTVADTGQGISPGYLKTKLFQPFSQESSLTPGTGLGLSLVKSLVDMLGGEIDVSSIQGEGTSVVVRLPMSKGTQAKVKGQAATPPNSSGSSIVRVKDDSIDRVKMQAPQTAIAFFDTGRTDERYEAARMLKNSVLTYLQDWYGFTPSVWDRTKLPDIIVAEKLDVSELTRAVPQLMDPQCQTVVLVLCHTACAALPKDVIATHANFEEIRYPFGPFKLARAIRNCLEKPKRRSISQPAPSSTMPTSLNVGPRRSLDDVVEAVENLSLPSINIGKTEIPIVKSGSVCGREDSQNAQMAMNHIGSLEISDGGAGGALQAEFPFEPSSDPQEDGTASPTIMQEISAAAEATHNQNHHRTNGIAPPLEDDRISLGRPRMPPMRRTISPTRQEIAANDNVETDALSIRGVMTNHAFQSLAPSPRTPRMLLVDDNRINLKLLQTFMKKRRYTAVTNAEDGLQAVQAYTSLLHKNPPEPPDIILMDISMPIMNGFEATRKIREIEAKHRETLSPMETLPSCLIIALTGLASGRDQSEAFTSGFDLYITKPVSFSEISRLLDNWETNGGAGSEDRVPHGAVTGAVGRENVDGVANVLVDSGYSGL